ncbi:hypothetical protein BsWGS_26306 [Bradybaena similaris]
MDCGRDSAVVIRECGKDGSSTELHPGRYSASTLIRSYNFASGRYRNSENCQVQLWADSRPLVLTVTFNVFEVESESKCRMDYLCINGVSFCGSWEVNKTFTFRLPAHRSFTLRFVTDASVARRGFEIRLDAKITDEHTQFSEVSQGYGSSEELLIRTMTRKESYRDRCLPEDSHPRPGLSFDPTKSYTTTTEEPDTTRRAFKPEYASYKTTPFPLLTSYHRNGNSMNQLQTHNTIRGDESNPHTTDNPIYGTNSNPHKTDNPISDLTPNRHPKNIYVTLPKPHNTDIPDYDTTAIPPNTKNSIYNTMPNLFTTGNPISDTTSGQHKTELLIYDTVSDSHKTDKSIYDTTSSQHKTDLFIYDITSNSHKTEKSIYDTTSSQHKTDLFAYDTVSDSHKTDKSIYDTTSSQHKTDLFAYDTVSDSHRTDKSIYDTTSSQHKTDLLINDNVSDSHKTNKPIYVDTSNPQQGADNTSYDITTNNPPRTVRPSNNITSSSDETHHPRIGNSLAPHKTDITSNPMETVSGNNDQRIYDTTAGVLSTSKTSEATSSTIYCEDQPSSVTVSNEKSRYIVKSGRQGDHTGYTNNERCVVIYETPNKSKMFTVAVKTFDIEYHKDCCYDSLCLKGVKFCGDWAAGHSFVYVVPASSTFTIAFNTDESKIGRGFEMEITIKDPPADEEVTEAFSGVGSREALLLYKPSNISEYTDKCQHPVPCASWHAAVPSPETVSPTTSQESTTSWQVPPKDTSFLAQHLHVILRMMEAAQDRLSYARDLLASLF